MDNKTNIMSNILRLLKKNRFLFISISILAILLLALSIKSAFPDAEDLEFIDMKGELYKIEDFKGKVVFLNFWATWCKPCIDEMSSIKQLKSEFKNDEIVFILASNEEISKIRNFKSKIPERLSIYQYRGGLGENFPKILPATYLIDINGKTTDFFFGAKEWNSNQMKTYIDKILPAKSQY